MLQSFDSWESISDTELLVEYLVLTEKNTIKILQCRGNAPAIWLPQEAVVSTRLSYDTTGTADWALRNADVVITAFDGPVKVPGVDYARTEILSVLPIECRLVLQKLFRVRSHSVPSASFTCSLKQFWTGKNFVEAQQKLEDATIIPSFSFSCDIVHLDHPEHLTIQQRIMLFASLLMKMQDFLEYPVSEAWDEEKDIQICVFKEVKEDNAIRRPTKRRKIKR
jgi:hypothetical protein